MKFKHLILFFFLFKQSSAFTQKTYQTKIQKAKAYNSKQQQKLIYTETHKIIYKDGKLKETLTTYHDHLRNLIAKMESDYTENSRLPTYKFYNFNTKTEEGLRITDGQHIIFYKKNNEEKTYKLKDTKDIFSGQGWHYYILQNIETMQKGQNIVLNLIFPSRLDYYKFRLRKTTSTNNILNLILEFDNWFFRLFFPKIELSYNIKDKRIISYYGPSNILDSKGNSQNVYILYDK
jgi:hypothetical protein